MTEFKQENHKLTADEKLNLLVEFGTRISSELRLDKLLDIIARQITRMLNVGRCTIYLKDVERNELWSKIAQGRGLEHTEIRLPLDGNNIAAIVARTGQAINLQNAYDDERFSMAIDMVTDFRTHTLLTIPLKNNSGKVLGVFQVANKEDGSVFDNKDEGILLLLATLAASSIEIAKLYQDVHVAQLETIYRLAVTAEYRDQQDTRSHLKNISIISYLLALALGMTKKEIDSKFDEIVRFAEMEKFIDTPVKRYSSGMYVKLAFAVAAHLDSEIMIMDEVLAVGDMAFQTKCLDKMSDVSKKDGRTILYISHNMTTIRQLCERCIVLDHGTVIFDGDVEQAIAIYQNKGKISFPSAIDYSNLKRMDVVHTDTQAVSFESLQFPGRKEATFNDENIMPLILEACVKKPVKNAALRIEFYTMDDRGVCAVFSQEFDLEQVGRKTMEFDINISELVAGEYKGVISLYSVNEYGTKYEIDAVAPAFCVKINRFMNIEWLYRYWGNVKLNNFAVTVANKQNGIANERRT